jgi:hypothetical protein
VSCRVEEHAVDPTVEDLQSVATRAKKLKGVIETESPSRLATTEPAAVTSADVVAAMLTQMFVTPGRQSSSEFPLQKVYGVVQAIFVSTFKCFGFLTIYSRPMTIGDRATRAPASAFAAGAAIAMEAAKRANT